jgi:DNA-binding CsgD family transcriptional regulator
MLGSIMDRQVKITGLFWGATVGIGFIVDVLVGTVVPGGSIMATLVRPKSLLVLASIVLLFASGSFKGFAWIQPGVMFVLTPLYLLRDHGSFYGLSFFIVGVMTLFRLGFYERHRVVKLSICTLYLLGCELFAVLRSGGSPYSALPPVFFMTVFILFFHLAYAGKLAVFLREPKPLLSLAAKGLSAAERVYVKAVVEGRSPKEVAVDYSVSESTVRNTLARAYKKLGIEDKSALAALAESCRISD